METKFRVWDGKYKEEIDLYWFEENGVREVVDGVGKGHYGKVTVMQYTGLKDTNGREVWEGDVMARKDFYQGYQVLWSDSGGCWCIDSDKTRLHAGLIRKASLAVIGNIYENPELLE